MTSSPKMSERLCGKSDCADSAEKVCVDAGPHLSASEFHEASINERPVAAGAASTSEVATRFGEVTVPVEQPLGVASARTSWGTGVGWSGAGAMDGRSGVDSIEVVADIDFFDVRYGVLQKEEPREAMDGGAGGRALGVAAENEALDARYGQEDLWDGAMDGVNGGEVFGMATLDAALVDARYGQEEDAWGSGGSSDSSWGDGLGGRGGSSESLGEDLFGSPEAGVPPIAEVHGFVAGGAAILAHLEEDMSRVDNPRWRRSNAEVLEMKLSRDDREVLMLFDMMSVAEEEEILRGEGGSRHRTQSGSSISVDDDGILLLEPILNEELLETSMEKACIEKEKEERRAITAERSRKRRMREQSQAPKVKSPRLEALVEEDMEVEEQGPPPHEETQLDTEGSDTLDTLEFLEKAMPDLDADDAWRDTPLPDEDEHQLSPIRTGRSPRQRRQSEEEMKRKRSRSRSPNIPSTARNPSPTRRSPSRRSITPVLPDLHQLAHDASIAVKSALEYLASLPILDSNILDRTRRLQRATTTLARIQKTPQLNASRVEKDLERINRLLEEVAPQPIQQQPPTRRYPVRQRQPRQFYGQVILY